MSYCFAIDVLEELVSSDEAPFDYFEYYQQAEIQGGIKVENRLPICLIDQYKPLNQLIQKGLFQMVQEVGVQIKGARYRYLGCRKREDIRPDNVTHRSKSNEVASHYHYYQKVESKKTEIEEAPFSYLEYENEAKIQAPKDEPDPEKQFVSAFGPKDQREPFTVLTQAGLLKFIEKTGCCIEGGTYIYLGLRQNEEKTVPEGATHRSKADGNPGYYHYYKKL